MKVSRVRQTLLVAATSFLAGALLFAQAPAKNAHSQKAAPATADKAAIERGKTVYKDSCAVCHYAASTAKKIGPGLKGLSRRGKFADGKPVDDPTLRAWIEAGGKDMPSFKDSLKPEQVTDLIAYLKTL